MINKDKINLVALSSILLMVTACAPKEKNFGDNLLNRGDAIHEIGEKWAEGNTFAKEGAELTKSGQDDVVKGEALMSEGKEKIQKGEALMSKGNQMKMTAEATYKVKTENPVKIPA